MRAAGRRPAAPGHNPGSRSPRGAAAARLRRAAAGPRPPPAAKPRPPHLVNLHLVHLDLKPLRAARHNGRVRELHRRPRLQAAPSRGAMGRARSQPAAVRSGPASRARRLCIPRPADRCWAGRAEGPAAHATLAARSRATRPHPTPWAHNPPPSSPSAPTFGRKVLKPRMSSLWPRNRSFTRWITPAVSILGAARRCKQAASQQDAADRGARARHLRREGPPAAPAARQMGRC